MSAVAPNIRLAVCTGQSRRTKVPACGRSAWILYEAPVEPSKTEAAVLLLRPGLPLDARPLRACYRTAAHSRQRFDGLREEILDRDGRLCRACGSAGRLHVHHRKPGVNDPGLLITVCAGCHARLHLLAALRIWIPEPLVALWAEQHPGVPVQLQLPVAA